MPWSNIREWVADLETREDLVEIDEPVSTKFDIAAYIKKSCNESGPAFRFTNVADHDMDVIGGLYGTKRRILDSLDVDSHGEGVALYERATDEPIEPEVVRDGPVRDIVDTNPDLNDLPIVHHSERDAGHYITAGVVVANLPHTGVRGQGITRMMRIGSDETTIYSPEERRIGHAYRKNAEAGEPTEIACVIGASPAVTMGSISNVPHTIDKYSVAGRLLGEPIELVECETVDIEVPANAELVIEGRIQPERQASEAPFGEFPGCYSGEQRTPVVEITGIMRRADTLYQTILTGFPPTENNLMHLIPRGAIVKEDAERAVPYVDQALTKCGESGGNGVYEAFVSIDKNLDGDPWNVISNVLGGRSQAKYCTVVDDDIDLFDEKQVNWAKNTRVQPDRDVHVFPRMNGAPLDPSGPPRQTAKMGIDATVPLDEDREKYERVRVPRTDEVDW